LLLRCTRGNVDDMKAWWLGLVVVVGCSRSTGSDDTREEMAKTRQAVDALSARVTELDLRIQHSAAYSPHVQVAAGAGSGSAASVQIYVTTEPPGAAVIVDGKPVGSTPITVSTTAPKFHLKLDKSGYLPIERDVSTDAGASVAVALTKVP
jgi:hypothetical protein